MKYENDISPNREYQKRNRNYKKEPNRGNRATVKSDKKEVISLRYGEMCGSGRIEC